jgi:hypothetical protein
MSTPQVMVHMEFDSLAAWQRFLASERSGELMFELRALGCTNMALHVWDASPLVPDPVLPPGGCGEASHPVRQPLFPPPTRS